MFIKDFQKLNWVALMINEKLEEIWITSISLHRMFILIDKI